MEKLQACVSRLLTWLRRLPGWFQVHLSRLTRVRGIRQRWLMNSVSFLVMVLAVVVIVFGLIVKNYYDSSILSDMESKARTAVNYFSSTSSNYNSADGDYLSAAQDYVSSFQDGTRLELQYLDPEGTVIYSSNGLTISGSVPGTGDINQLQHTQTISAWRGVSPQTGERVTAVSAPLLYNGKLVGILRYVTSMRLVDRQVIILTLIAVILSVSILILVYLSNIYFVRSIVGPVKNITDIARRIAGGSYGIQVEKKFDDEVGDLTDAINDMSLRIKQAESMKQEFISSVSHELRTPLTAINGWSETLLSGEVTDPESIQKGLSIVVSEGHRLSKMVEELLEFSRIEDGRFTLNVEPVDIQAEFEDAIFTYRQLYRKKHIRLDYHPCEEEFPPIPGDPERLRQVFSNLLDNAAKHGGSDQVIEVGLEREGDAVVIFIRDHGPGVAEKDLPHVKEKFYKGSSKARGSGIGLAVCDEIITRLNGQLTIANAEGGGCIVTIRLPMLNPTVQEP